MRAWYHFFICIVFVPPYSPCCPGLRQIPIAKTGNFRDDASDRWPARVLSPGFGVSGFVCPYQPWNKAIVTSPETQTRLRTSGCPKDFFRPSSALREMHLGSGQKESVSEEALRWKSSVFRHGRYAA